MSKTRFISAWDVTEDASETALNLKLRSILMTALKAHLVRADIPQAQAAALFGTTQLRVADLLRGKIRLFDLEALVKMAAAAGLRVEMQVHEAPDIPKT